MQKIGFYIRPTSEPVLLVGPYNGRPACSSISLPGKGVCANTFTSGKGTMVPNVEEYPGHIGASDQHSSFLLQIARVKIKALTKRCSL